MEPKKDRTLLYIIVGLITLLVLIFIFQNREETTIRFLGMSLDGPRFLVFLILYGVGFFSGWLWSLLRRGKKTKAANEQKPQPKPDQG